MNEITQRLARLVGTTLEDWLLAALLVATLALVVVGVRGCADDYGRETRSQAEQSR